MSDHEPGDLWADREELAAEEWRARHFWAELTDEQRAGIGLVVTEMLFKLIREQDRWLPASVTGGRRIDVKVSLQLSELDEAAARARGLAEHRRLTRENNALALLKGLEK